MNEDERKIKEKELDTKQGEELKRLVRSMLAAKGYTLESLAKALNEKYPVKESKANLSNKLLRGSLKYIDFQRIAEILDYDIEPKQRQKQPTE